MTNAVPVRQSVRDLIHLYVGNIDDGHARVKMNEVYRRIDNTWLIWIGCTQSDSTFYYRVQSLLVLDLRRQLPIKRRATAYLAAIEAALEPLCALCARSMGPALRTHCTPTHLLQIVVPYGRCRFECALDIVFMHDVSLLSAVAPYAGKAVGLQFQIDRKRILFALVLLR